MQDVNNSKKTEDSPAPPDNTVVARDNFDVRVRRGKKKINGKLILTALGIFSALIAAVVIIIWIAVSNMNSNKQSDDSNVKADAALEPGRGKDDSMINHLKQKEKEDERSEDNKSPAATDNLPPAQIAPVSVNNSSESNPGSVVDIQPVQETGIFPVVARFKSDGLSAASAGGNQDIYSEQSDRELDEIRSFADMSVSEMNGGNYNQSEQGSDSGRPLLPDNGSVKTPVRAHLMPSRKYLVTHNTYARCALYTEIITDQPGLVECRLTEPLYSADGSVVIAYAGDKLTGEQKIEVRAGQSRVYTTWTELETASGVRAELNSLGAGRMGASGTEAWIDNHYQQRFGGAVMLSFVQDALQSAANTTQKSGNGYTVNNSEQNVQNMAEKALDNSINIPPTAYVLPGTVITVIVARDIDFSPVFSVR